MSTIVLSGLKKKILLAGFTFTVSLFLFLIYLYYKYGRIITYKFFLGLLLISIYGLNKLINKIRKNGH